MGNYMTGVFLSFFLLLSFHSLLFIICSCVLNYLNEKFAQRNWYYSIDYRNCNVNVKCKVGLGYLAKVVFDF